MNTIQTSTAQLMKLPLHILQRIAGSNDRSKRDLSADIAINLASGGVRFVEAEIADEFIRIEYMGTKIGAIDTTRGRQEFVTLSDTTDDWSKDWEALIFRLFASMDIRNEEHADESKTITLQECDEMIERAANSEMHIIEVPGVLVDEYALIDDESGTADLIESHLVNTQQSRLTVRTVSADEAYEWVADKLQDEYEDSTDQSLSPAEHTLKQRYPNSADRIIEMQDETFEVDTEGGVLVITDLESGTVILAQHNAESGTWKAYLTNGEFYGITCKPVGWMAHIANYRN